MDNLIGINVEGRRLGYGTTGRLEGFIYAGGRELIRGQRIAEFEGPDICSDEGREVAECPQSDGHIAGQGTDVGAFGAPNLEAEFGFGPGAEAEIVDGDESRG